MNSDDRRGLGGDDPGPGEVLDRADVCVSDPDRRDDAIALYERVLEENAAIAPGGPNANFVARALVGFARVQLARTPAADASTVLSEVMQRFAPAPEPTFPRTLTDAVERQAEALVKCGEYALALAASRLGETSAPESDASHDGPRGARVLLAEANALRGLGRVEDALRHYQTIASRYEHVVDERAPLVVAMALSKKGDVLRESGRFEDAAEVFGDVAGRWQRLGSGPAGAVAVQAAERRLGALRKLERWEDLCRAAEEAVPRFEAGEVSGAPSWLGINMRLEWTMALHQLGRFDDERVVYDEIAARYDREETPEGRQRFARALMLRARFADSIGRRAEAITGAEGVLHQFGDSPELGPRSVALEALNFRAQMLFSDAQTEAGAVAVGALVDRLGVEESDEVVVSAASHVLIFANKLSTRGQHVVAIDLLEGLRARLRDASEPDARSVLARALYELAFALIRAGRMIEGATVLVDELADLGPDALEIFDEVVARNEGSSEPAKRLEHAKALLGRAVILERMQLPDEAFSALRTAIARLDGEDDEASRDLVASAERLLEAFDQQVPPA